MEFSSTLKQVKRGIVLGNLLLQKSVAGEEFNFIPEIGCKVYIKLIFFFFRLFFNGAIFFAFSLDNETSDLVS